MFARHSSELHDLLQELRLVPPDQLAALFEEHRVGGKPLAELVVAAGCLTRPALLEHVSRHLGYARLRAWPARIGAEVLRAVPGELVRKHRVMPIAVDPQGVDLVLGNPFDPEVAEDVGFGLDQRVRWWMADPDEIESRIRQHYGDAAQGESTGPALDLAALGLGAREALTSEQAVAALAQQRPIITFVDLVLGQAIRDRASDIHFEPFEDEFKIRYRIDGVLYEMAPPPPQLGLPIVSRIKVLANLNIAERRVPQDGRMTLTVEGRPVDLRVSTLPTQFGESLVLRVLDRAAVRLELGQLGLPPAVYRGVQDILRRPNGIFVVTGPTGSGKTTTLYSGLQSINTLDLKLLTAEDPVEFEIEGVVQVPVNPAIGLSFAAALRSFLRQDPDVIMVGEIRDEETAQIAIQAALTGHLVLSTLHTNDAAGAVTRLLDMGIEPFLIAATLEAVLAQRLVRKVCPECRTAYEPAAELLGQLGLSPGDAPGRRFFHGRGCPTCSQSGYKGRHGLYEWLRLTEGLRELVTQRAPTLTLRERARQQGMRTLREDGLRALHDGHTSIEEVIKAT